MLFATASVLHRIFTFDASPRLQLNTALTLFAFMVGFSTWHVITDELAGHALLFGAMIVAVAYKTSRILAVRYRDQPVERSRLSRLALLGAVSFVSGYVLWHVDFLACKTLISARRALGMPLGFLLEMHGWWHILTAVGVYCFMALIECLTNQSEARSKHGLAWPVNMYLKPPGAKVS
jgi:dihydroceramidase